MPTETQLHRLLPLLCCLIVGCGGGSTSTDAGTDASAGTDSGPAITNATCTFDLVDGSDRVIWQGRARARMNGSANLLVECLAVEDGSDLRLNIGNATFDGPRVYQMDDFTSDGSIIYDLGDSEGTYRSRETGASCTVDLREAVPLDARGDSVLVGGQVSGTLNCSAIVNDRRTPSTLVIENGTFTATIE